MQKKSGHVLLCALALVILTTPGMLLAQESEGRLAEEWKMTVKSGHQAEFETALKAHMAVRKDNGDSRQWDVYTPVTGENLNDYVIRACCFNWADFDGFTAWDKNKPTVMQDWFANVDMHVEHYAHFFEEIDMDNSHWPDDGKTAAYVGVTEFYIAPGAASEFATARGEMSQVAINQGWATPDHQWVWGDQIGGKPTNFLAVGFENYADMAPGEQSFFEFLAEKMGAEMAANLLNKFSSSTHGSEYTIYQHRTDLSTSMD